MKKLIILLLVTMSMVCLANKPYASLLGNISESLGTSGADTTVYTVNFEGDSTGIQIYVDQDSIKIWVRYEHLTYAGYSTGAAVSALSEIIATSYVRAGFSYRIPVLASVNKCRVYVIIQNKHYNTRTVTANVYSVNYK